MSRTIRVSEGFHDRIKGHQRDDETMEDTLRRLIGGPSPEALAEIVAGCDDAAAEEMWRAIEAKRDRGRDRREERRERFD